MKKVFLMIACVTFLMKVSAQNDSIMTIPQLWSMPSKVIRACVNKYDRVLLYAPENCTGFKFRINGEWIHEVSPVIFDKTVMTEYHNCKFYGCGYDFAFDVFFINPNVPNETTTELWKRQYEPITLEAPSGSYTYLWNTGATTATIEVIEPGTYTCGVSDMCATSMQTFIVQDNVEIDLSTCDLETNLNMITWQTTPVQAQYIDHVI